MLTRCESRYTATGKAVPEYGRHFTQISPDLRAENTLLASNFTGRRSCWRGWGAGPVANLAVVISPSDVVAGVHKTEDGVSSATLRWHSHADATSSAGAESSAEAALYPGTLPPHHRQQAERFR
ncbi:hypothetical protein J6590_015719 [Homalodisca vitripennis]|nr:hypothetical protein J6590_015719 [Homalodisca vitripennis]